MSLRGTLEGELDLHATPSESACNTQFAFSDQALEWWANVISRSIKGTTDGSL